MNMETTEIKQVIEFMKEVDKFKTTYRSPFLSQDLNRKEDDAQHSWHLALFVILTKDFFNTDLNHSRMLELALIHDMVEIYAGDTFAFDEKMKESKKEREKKAAQDLFSQLPKKLEKKFHSINSEYELKTSMEAKIVGALDKIVPIIQNLIAEHKAWKKHNISLEQIQEFINQKARINPTMNEISNIVASQVDQAHNKNPKKNKLANKSLNLIIEFMKETDKFKTTYRKTDLSQDLNRYEDDAQHSWHLALWIILLKDHFSSSLDYAKMLELALTHDLVEIYAGDTFAYDQKAIESKKERESIAAQKLFSQLPKNLQKRFHSLNDEFIKQESFEAKHVSALDILTPKILNILTNFKTWKEEDVPYDKVKAKVDKFCKFNEEIRKISEILMKEHDEKYNEVFKK